MKQCQPGTWIALTAFALFDVSSSSFAQNAPQLATTSHTIINTFRNDDSRSGYVASTVTYPVSVSWKRTETSANGNPASPVYADGILYYAVGKNIYAVNGTNGQLVWTFATTGTTSGYFTSTPAITSTALYVGADDSTLYKLDIKTGKSLWQVKAAGPIRTSPVVDENKVFFGSDDNSGYAVDADTGQQIWSHTTDGAITAPPTLVQDSVVFASADNTLYSVNESTGRTLWSQRLPDDPSISFPVLSGNVLYVGGGEELYALTPRTGSIRWHAQLSSEITTPVSAGPDGLYIATNDNKVQCIVGRGRVAWTATLDYPCQANILVTRNSVIVPTQHGTIYAFDPNTGLLQWEYVVQPSRMKPGEPAKSTDIASEPLYADGSLFVLSDDGAMTAFRADSPDNSAPRVGEITPAAGSLTQGLHTPYKAILIDDGTGIQPSSVVFSVDGKVLSKAKYDSSQNAMVIDFNNDLDGTATPNLGDGNHHATLIAKDWRGNSLTKTWGFTVDTKLNPEDRDAVTDPGTPTLQLDTTGDAPALGLPPAGPPATVAPPVRPNGKGNGATPPPPPPI